jgi:hypothetical protein
MARSKLTDEERKRRRTEYYHEYAQLHPERARESSRRYRQNHPDRRNEIQTRYRESHLEQVRKKNEKFKEINREKVRLAGRIYYATHKDQYQQWQNAHPEYAQAGCRRRRAKMAQLPHTLTTTERKQKRAGGCMFCGTRENLQVAHDIPVTRNGGLTDDNTICLCRRCNSRMNTRTLAEVLGLPPL